MPSTSLQWLSLVVIIWLQSINGTNSNFPAYSSQFKQHLSISQLQLNNLAFASDAGKLFGFFSGVAALYLPLWLLLLIGSVLGFIGYGLQYLFLTHYISSLTYPHVFFLTMLAGNSICWINTVCYVVTIHNFPLDRQVAVGLTTSYQGLSAKIYTVLVETLFFSSPEKRASAYLLLNSVLPLVVCVIAAPMVRVRDNNIDVGKGKKCMKNGFIAMFFITIITGVFAIFSSLEFKSSGFWSRYHLVNTVGTLLLLSAPLVIPLTEKIKERVKRGTKVYGFTMEEEVIEGGVVVKDGDHDERIKEVNFDDDNDQVLVKEEIGVKLMLKRLDFWLYFWVYFCGATIGLVYLNNLGQIGESRGCSKTSSLVSLAASFGFFGRLLPSLFDYFFSRSRYLISRPASIAALMVPMTAALILLTTNYRPKTSLYISTAIIGISTGAITSLSVSTTAELFGTKNFSVNHNVVVSNIPIGSFVFGYFAALVYHREGRDHGGSDGGRCFGMHCYRNTFIVWGSLCSLGTFLALILHARLRDFYSNNDMRKSTTTDMVRT